MSETTYRVTGIEMEETRNGDPYKAVTLSNGATFNVFNRNGHYPKVDEGYEIKESDLYEKKGYVNILDPDKDKLPKGAKPVDFDNIGEKDMSRKEYSIKLSSTANKAVEMVAAEISAGHISESKKTKQDRWKMWRRFLWDNWEHPEDYTDPDDIITD